MKKDWVEFFERLRKRGVIDLRDLSDEEFGLYQEWLQEIVRERETPKR